MNGELQRLLNGRWGIENGVIIPSQKPPSNIWSDTVPIASYVTFQEVTGFSVSLDDVIRHVQQKPREHWLLFVAWLSVRLARNPAVISYQSGLVSSLLSSDLRHPVLNLMRQQNRVFFSQKTLLGITKLALAFAKSDPHSKLSFDVHHMTTTYLELSDHIDVGMSIQNSTNPLEEITKFFVQNISHGTGADFVEMFTRVWTILHSVPSDEDFIKKGYVHPTQLFNESAKVLFEETISVGFGLVARYLQQRKDALPSDMPFAVRDYFEPTKLPHSTVDKVIERMVLIEKDIVKMKREDVLEPHYFYDFSALSQKPLVDFGNGYIVPINYSLLQWRVSEGLFWDAFQAVSDKDKDQFYQEFGQYFQRWVEGLFLKAFPDMRPLGRRLWIEPKQNDQAPAVDLIVSYPGAYIFVEVTGSRFEYIQSEIHGSPKVIEKDLEKMLYGEVEQLHKAIDYFRNGGLNLDGQKWAGEAIYPVLITYGTVPNIEPVWTYLNDHISDRGWLQQPHTRPLVCVDASEAHLLPSFPLKGVSLVEVLDKKSSVNNKGLPWRNFVLREFPSFAGPPEILRQEWDALSEQIQITLFPSE